MRGRDGFGAGAPSVGDICYCFCVAMMNDPPCDRWWDTLHLIKEQMMNPRSGNSWRPEVLQKPPASEYNPAKPTGGAGSREKNKNKKLNQTSGKRHLFQSSWKKFYISMASQEAGSSAEVKDGMKQTSGDRNVGRRSLFWPKRLCGIYPWRRRP